MLSNDSTPTPRPHVVMRYYPATHNLLNQYLPAETRAEQSGWIVKDEDGVSGWAMDPDGARRAYERMVARRA